MSTGASANDCIADILFANTTLAEFLAMPFLGDSDYCSPIIAVASSAAIHHLTRTISSFDLNLFINIPDHPALSSLGYSLESNTFSGKYSVSLPDVPTLLGVQIGVFVGVLMGAIFATILYYTLHNHRRQIAPLGKLFIGVTLVLASLLLPYTLIEVMGVQNSAIRFTISILFVLYMFRTLEATFGFTPTGAKSSLGVYCAYFSLPFDMMFDEETTKPIMATKRDILNGQINLMKAVACIVMLCSILSPCGYAPFGETNAGEFHESIVVRDYLDARHLGNCFAIAIFFQQGLALGDSVFGNVIQTVLGYKAKQTMRNPMLEATSPSDFWGRRWNVLVHSVMKRGVYKPVRKYSSSAVVASLAVFIASGLFHEWLVHVVFLHDRPLSSGSDVLLGSNTAFFIWNFVIIVSERLLAGRKAINSLGKMIPGIFIPSLIIMTSLPMAHWFGNPYLKGGFFEDYEKCLFLIRKV